MTSKNRLNPINIGIIGVGRGGQDQVVWIAKLKSEYRLVAVCDADPERAVSVAEPHGAAHYSDLKTFLNHPALELVTIANRSVDHYATAMACLKAGKHVLVEKPVTITAAGAKRLVGYSKQAAARLFVHHNRRFDAGFVKVQEILKSGVLGQVQQIKLRRLSYQRRNDWQTLKEFGGGQLLNWGPHIIDHALVLLGSPVIDQWSQLRQVAAAGDCEDHLLINLLGRNGRYASVEISGGTAISEPAYHIVGSKGTLVGGDKELKVKYLDPAQKLRPPRAKKSTPQGYGSGADLKWIEKTITPEPVGYTIWHALFDAIRKNAKYPVSNDHVVEIMTVIDRAKKGTPFANPARER